MQKVIGFNIATKQGICATDSTLIAGKLSINPHTLSEKLRSGWCMYGDWYLCRTEDLKSKRGGKVFKGDRAKLNSKAVEIDKAEKVDIMEKKGVPFVGGNDMFSSLAESNEIEYIGMEDTTVVTVMAGIMKQMPAKRELFTTNFCITVGVPREAINFSGKEISVEYLSQIKEYIEEQ